MTYKVSLNSVIGAMKLKFQRQCVEQRKTYFYRNTENRKANNFQSGLCRRHRPIERKRNGYARDDRGVIPILCTKTTDGQYRKIQNDGFQ